MSLTRVTDNVVTPGTITPNKLSTGGPAWGSSGVLSAVGFVGDGSALGGVGTTTTNDTIFKAITSNYINAYITAEGFVGDGSGLTNVFPPLSVVEINKGPFLVTSEYENCTVLINSNIDIDIIPGISNILPGHKTTFVQIGNGRGKFESNTIVTSVSGAYYTKGQYAKTFLVYGESASSNEWVLYGDLISDAVPAVPTYTLYSNVTSVNEGATVTVNLSTTYVSNGNVPYTVTGTINSADLSGSSAGMTGNFNLVNNSASIVFALSSDRITEGIEFINLNLDNGQAAIAIQVNDTSQSSTYSLTTTPSSSTFNEGQTIIVTLSTQGISNGTNVPYYVQTWGEGFVNANDFSVGSDALTGNFTINSSTASKTFIFAADKTTEGNETFILTLSGGLGASISVTLLDTSIFIPEFTQVAAGQIQSYALSGTTLYSVGDNFYGQLGLGSRNLRSTFTKILSAIWSSGTTVLNPQFSAVVSNGATVYALSANASGSTWVYACGYNSSGQLGTNDRANYSFFTRTGAGGSIAKIVPGGTAAYALDNKKRIYSVGGNSDGQLSKNDTVSRSAWSLIGKAEWESPHNSDAEHIVDDVASAGASVIALTANNLWVCGKNTLGTLGLNDLNNRSRFTKVTLPANAKWTNIAAGYESFYALSGTDLYACGRNVDGELGLNNRVNQKTFTKVNIPVNAKWSNIYSEGYHLYAISGTDVYVCGHNPYGQFGLGDTASRSTLTKIPNNWLAVSPSTNFTLYLSTNNVLFGSGYNYTGNLGLNNINNYITITGPVISAGL